MGPHVRFRSLYCWGQGCSARFMSTVSGPMRHFRRPSAFFALVLFMNEKTMDRGLPTVNWQAKRTVISQDYVSSAPLSAG